MRHHIFRRMSGPVTALMFFMILNSCIREDIPATESDFTLDIVSRKMSKVTSTRAIDEQIENFIYSLYIYVSDGGKIKSIKHVSIDNPAVEYTCKLEPMSSSCVIYAVANAEFAENTFNADELADKLEKITTAEELHSIVAEYASGKISLARPQGHLLMSGTLVNPSPTNKTLLLHHIDASVKFEVSIGKAAAENGASFEMTEYQVFNLPRKSFLYDRKGENAECTPPSSLVYGDNVTSCPWDAVSRTAAEDYYSSDILKNFSTGYDIYKTSSGQEIRRRISEFDFYMLENRKLALATTGNAYPDNYGKRDDRISDTDRTFKYADEFSTYVVIKGIFKDPKMGYDLKDELSQAGGSYIPDEVARYSQVEYTVHLGNFDSVNNKDSNVGTDNFFTERNTRYTYRVTVLNTKDIAVEAIKEEEKAPSAEGDVLDSYHAAYGEFDAHFGSMVIGVELPRNADGSLDMTYFNDPERCLISNCPYGEDYSWIQFAPMHGGDINEGNKRGDTYNALSYEYCRSQSRLVSMAMLPDWILNTCDQYDSQGNERDISWLGLTNKTNTGNNKVWFTIFVDENYPQAGQRNGTVYRCKNHGGTWGQCLFWEGYCPEETPSCAAMRGRTGRDPENPDWRSYINVPNREFRLFNDKYTSDDKASKYSLSRVYVTQRSIQSYYDIDALDASSSIALGVEHWDEPGKQLHRSRENDGNDGTRPIAYPVGTGIDDEDGLTASRCWFKGLSSVWNWSADGTEAYSAQRDNSAAENRRWDHWLNLRLPTNGSQYNEPADRSNAWHELLFLQRNRDINANGIIELDEIRWFNPAFYQVETISMNGNALVTPLYDRSLPATTGPGSNEDPQSMTRDRHIMWYITSSLSQIWVDEVTSGGSYISWRINNPTPSMNYRENYMRCARNLGANAFNSCPDDPRNAVGTKAPSVYHRDENGLSITPVNLNPRVLREPILKGELVPMNQFDKFNSISRTGFTVADMKVSEYYPAPTMEALDRGQSPCKDYWEGSETDPKTGKGCWRTPNSLELTLMMMTRVLIANQGWSTKAGYENAYDNEGARNTLSLMSCTKYHWSYATDDTGLTFTLLPTYDNEGNNIGGTGYVTWHASHNHHFLTYIDDHIRLSDSNYWSGVVTEWWDDMHVSHRLRCVRDN